MNEETNTTGGELLEKLKRVQTLSNAICDSEPTLTEADCASIAFKVYMASELERWLETTFQESYSRWELRVDDSWDRFMERAIDRTKRQR